MFGKGKGASALAERAKKKKEEAAADASSSSSSSGPDAKQTSAMIRIQKDLSDLELPSNVTLKKEDDMNYSMTINVDSGHWKGGIFEFSFSFPTQYPFQGPKVQCIDKIWHPNIDLEGGVCVSVLRPWKPTYSMQHVLFGLLFLFTSPNPTDPLNHEAAADMRDSPTTFARNCISAMKGQRVGSTTFPKNRGTGF